MLPDADEALVEAAGWQLSSDSGEDVAHDHQEGQPPRRGVSSRTFAGLSSVVHGARPPYVPGSLRIPRPPPQADDAAAAVPRHRAPFIPRRVRSAWPKIEHSETATGKTNYLRMSVTAAKHHADLLAVCRYHGERCGRSRSMMKESLVGELWAWLNFGNVATSWKQHQEYVPDFTDRADAWVEFKSLGDALVREFLGGESGGIGLGEPTIYRPVST